MPAPPPHPQPPPTPTLTHPHPPRPSPQYYESEIKQRLLRYATSALLFSESRVNPQLISWNRVVLLHGWGRATPAGAEGGAPPRLPGVLLPARCPAAAAWSALGGNVLVGKESWPAQEAAVAPLC